MLIGRTNLKISVLLDKIQYMNLKQVLYHTVHSIIPELSKIQIVIIDGNPIFINFNVSKCFFGTQKKYYWGKI